ncbi:hypothetical protein J2808_004352 [Pseudarthrobacter sulfonivorans]|nr:hypothetical protein [Pseudarthrobacter sulfonivorans]
MISLTVAIDPEAANNLFAVLAGRVSGLSIM